jgi:hypothetical protein
MAFGEKCGSTRNWRSRLNGAQPSEMRHRGGVASHLEVLTNETNDSRAELGLVQAQSNEL